MGKKWGRTQAIFDEHMPDIERGYEAGAEVRELAERFGVSPPTITNWLIDAGYRRKKRGRYSNAMKAKAVELAERGWSAEAIANLFKVKIHWVLQWLGADAEQVIEYREVIEPAREDGRHKRGRRWTEAQKLEVLEHLNLGILSVANIYRLTGASARRQRAIWKEYMHPDPFPLARERPPRRPRAVLDPDVVIAAPREVPFQPEQVEGFIDVEAEVRPEPAGELPEG